MFDEYLGYLAGTCTFYDNSSIDNGVLELGGWFHFTDTHVAVKANSEAK